MRNNSQQHATGLWQQDVHTDAAFNIQQCQAVVGRGMHGALESVNQGGYLTVIIRRKNLYSATSIQSSNALHNKITQWETDTITNTTTKNKQTNKNYLY